MINNEKKIFPDDAETENFSDELIKILRMINNENAEPTDSCPELEKIIGFAFKELPVNKTGEIYDHVIRCNYCLNMVMDLREAEYKTQEAGEEVPELIPALAEVLEEAPLSSIIYNLKNTISSTLELLRIDMSPPLLAVRSSATHQEVKIENGGVLNSGDKFKIKFRLEQDCYVCILFKDSKGQISPIINEKVEGSKDIEVGSFELDENTGDENVIMLASISPIEDLDKQVEKIADSHMVNLENLFSDTTVKVINFKHK